MSAPQIRATATASADRSGAWRPASWLALALAILAMPLLQARSQEWPQTLLHGEGEVHGGFTLHLELSDGEVEPGAGQGALSGSEEEPPPAAAAPLSLGGLYSDDIQQVVNACGGEILRLYDFVRNNIRFVPYFGFRQGADMVLQTREANDADQADLLVTLLRAAGHSSARFEYGDMIVDRSLARSWFRVDDDTALNAKATSTGYLFAWVLNQPTKCVISSIWAKVDVDEIAYRLHPGFKEHAGGGGLDLSAATGYSRAALLAAAGGTAGNASISGVSDPGVVAYGTARADALRSAISGNHASSSVDALLGAPVHATSTTASLAAAFPPADLRKLLPFTERLGVFTEQTVVAIGYPITGGVNAAAGVSNYTLNLAGKRIGANFTHAGGNTTVRFWLDDTAIATSANLTGPVSAFFRISRPKIFFTSNTTLINVVYSNISLTTSALWTDDTYVFRVSPSAYGSGRYLQRRKQIADNYRKLGLPPESRERTMESLYLLNLEYGQDLVRMAGLLGVATKSEVVPAYLFATTSQGEAAEVDMRGAFTTVPRVYSEAAADACFRTTTVLASVLEQTVLEKLNPDDSAVSTVHYVRANNADGGKTFYATSANYNGSVATDSDFIAGWSSGFRNTTFPASINSGLNLVIPQNGTQVDQDLTGTGYFAWNSTQTGALITTFGYTLNGGYPTTTGHVDDSKDPKPKQPTDGPASNDNPKSEEPVDLLTGAYIYDRTDLDLGASAPRGLSLSRHYSSAGRDVETTLGGGWRHGYDIRVSPHADTAAALGLGTPEQAAQAIVACNIVNDLLGGEHTNAKGWVVASIIAGWLGDNLRDNAATLVSGRKNLSFIRLADGTYASPPGITSTLTKNATTGLFSIDERFGRLWAFDAENRASAFTDADGKSLTFAYHSGNGFLSTVTDTYGRNLTFTHNATGNFTGLLDAVSDSTGRQLSYTYTANRLLHTAKDPENHSTRFEYTPEGRIWQAYNELDQLVAENSYDSQGRVYEQQIEDDPNQVWQYSIAGARSTETSPLGLTTTHLFDERGRHTGIIDGTGNLTRMVYDGQDRLISRTDARNHTTTFEYDPRHNLTAVVNPNLSRTEFAYDANDRLDLTTDAGNFTTDFQYDTEHHLTKIIDPRLRETSFGYYTSGSHDGLLASRTENDSTVTTFLYDNFGNPQTTTRRDGSGRDHRIRSPRESAQFHHQHDRRFEHPSRQPHLRQSPTASHPPRRLQFRPDLDLRCA